MAFKYLQPTNTHTLIPRTTGVFHVIDRLRSRVNANTSSNPDSAEIVDPDVVSREQDGLMVDDKSAFTHLYDLTIAYTNIPDGVYADDVIPFTRFVYRNENDVRYAFLVRIERLPLESVPRERAEFDSWMYQRFERKSQLVRHVCEHNTWPPESHTVVHVERELPRPSYFRIAAFFSTSAIIVYTVNCAVRGIFALAA